MASTPLFPSVPQNKNSGYKNLLPLNNTWTGENTFTKTTYSSARNFFGSEAIPTAFLLEYIERDNALYYNLTDGVGTHIFVSNDPDGSGNYFPLKINPNNITLESLNCPTQSGYPIVASTDSSSRIATTEWVQSAISNSINTIVRGIWVYPNTATVPLSNNVPLTVATLNLTPGNWLINFADFLVLFSGTLTNTTVVLGISTLNNAFGGSSNDFRQVAYTVSGNPNFPTGSTIVSISENTTLYLVVSVFSPGWNNPVFDTQAVYRTFVGSRIN